ncbi:L,D-transpeptidase [Nodosilinea sp. PGN35]|uniref:L,D-transpeptidase n=1 Tax=Nodosilinea sp. PGN35 TaxID=3020489 RepID=UPI0023B2970E|nr:L,D-transpeptidase [Nodosilinea sp. TSF1-S3]MDF0365622.1 L,D-transpeptidase [Nodosilinea sp. TSF1-S3]
MLNRLINLTGLALVLSLTVPVAHQARSSYWPNATRSPVSEPEATGQFSNPLPQTAVLLSESSQALSAQADAVTPATDSTLALAPAAEDVRLEIHLRRREVLVYQGETVTNRYPVGVGRAGWETPVGTFQVRQMREHPTWISPFNGQRIPGGDARNPLGTRWIGFWTDGNNWIGFHGTRNPATVGRNSSHGCLHMHRADLEALYQQVRLGTAVTVRH